MKRVQSCLVSPSPRHTSNTCLVLTSILVPKIETCASSRACVLALRPRVLFIGGRKALRRARAAALRSVPGGGEVHAAAAVPPPLPLRRLQRTARARGLPSLPCDYRRPHFRLRLGLPARVLAHRALFVLHSCKCDRVTKLKVGCSSSLGGLRALPTDWS